MVTKIDINVLHPKLKEVVDLTTNDLLPCWQITLGDDDYEIRFLFSDPQEIVDMFKDILKKIGGTDV